MKRILKTELDQFYTKQELAKSIISDIRVLDYELIIDPSCGDGAFFLNIEHPNKIGIDIQPKIDNVIQQDFLEWKYDGNIERHRILCITNPPFGKQGSLCTKFIKHCIEFSDTIAFILPLSFKKPSVQKRINKNYHLIYEREIPKNSFLFNNNDYDVKCVFQIWKNLYCARPIEEITNPIGFKYVKKTENPDISIRRVGIYAGQSSRELNKSAQSHYFIKFNKKIDLNLLISEVNKIKWNDFTVGPRSISKSELSEVLNYFTK